MPEILDLPPHCAVTPRRADAAGRDHGHAKPKRAARPGLRRLIADTYRITPCYLTGSGETIREHLSPPS